MFKRIKDCLQGKAPLSAKRSKKWPEVRKQHLAKFPTCAVCEGDQAIEVHHIVPFSVDPSLELEPSNLITLCESKRNGITCHLAVGHLGKYTYQNPTVIQDAEEWKRKMKAAKEDYEARKACKVESAI